MQEIALYELPQLPVEDRIVWSLSPDGNLNSKTARNLIRQTYSKVDYAGIVYNKLNTPSTVLSPGWPSTLGFLQQIELADFIPTP